MQPIINYLRHPASLCDSLVKKLGQWLPDSTYIKLRYRFQMGKRLNLKDPKTFQEKLHWLMLHDRKPLYTSLVDKVLVKKYVTEKIGSQYVIPLLGVWERLEDIEWDKLPNRFVIKTNHSGGNTGVVICRDKSKFDKQKAIDKLNASLHHDVYKERREWPYKNVKPCVFAEEYLEDEYGELRDYKIFCFNGEPKALFIATDRQTPGVDLKFDFFDADYNHLDVRQGHPNADIPPQKPKSFELMKSLAKTLSAGIPQVRVDFYEINGQPYFGELTFCHFGGMVPFEPEEWDYKFGQWLDISNIS